MSARVTIHIVKYHRIAEMIIARFVSFADCNMGAF